MYSVIIRDAKKFDKFNSEEVVSRLRVYNLKKKKKKKEILTNQVQNPRMHGAKASQGSYQSLNNGSTSIFT